MSDPHNLRARSEAQTAHLPPLLIEAQRLAGSVHSGDHGRRLAGTGDDFWQYRPLQTGDSRAAIDHRRSARSDQAFVRERELKIAQSVMLWCDQGASMRYAGSKDTPTKAARARLLVMSVALLLNRAGERIGMGGPDLPPKGGQAQILRIAQMLSQDQAEDYSLPEYRTMPRNTAALFVSDFLGEFTAIQQALSRAADRGVRGVLLQILDPVEAAFPFQGRMIFESMKGTMRHETLKAGDLRGPYLARLEERKFNLRRLCEKTGWLYGLHHTGHPAQSGLLWLYQAMRGGGWK